MCSFDFVHTSLCCMRSLLSSPLSTERSGFSEFEKSEVLPRNEGKVRLWSFRPEDVPFKSREQAEEHAITIGCLIIAPLAPPLPYPLKSRTWERNNKEKKKRSRPLNVRSQDSQSEMVEAEACNYKTCVSLVLDIAAAVGSGRAVRVGWIPASPSAGAAGECTVHGGQLGVIAPSPQGDETAPASAQKCLTFSVYTPWTSCAAGRKSLRTLSER